MKGFCAVLGFRIEKETVCKASGNHSLCRRCQDLALGKGARGGQEEGSGHSPRETPQVEDLARIKRRRRCECGQAFIPRGNAQIRCDRCGKARVALKNREYQARFRKNRRNGLGVRVFA
jgi:hypothetical protein